MKEISNGYLAQPTGFFQPGGKVLGKGFIARRIGVYLVGFEAFIAQYFRPAALVIGDVFCFGEVGVKRVVAGIAERGGNAYLWHADEDGFCARVAAGLNDCADVGAGFAFRQAAEEVVTTDADDDQARCVFAQQLRQADKRLCASIAADAAVGDVPAADGGKAGGVGFGRACAVAVGKRIAEGEDGTATRQGGVFGSFFTAGGEGGSGSEDEKLASVHGFLLLGFL